MEYRPKIGITMRLEIETDRFYLGRNYCEALENFGAIPIHIGLIPKKDYISNLLKGLDGILLPGSNTDVDPLRFNEEPLIGFGRNIPIKDETDLLVLEEVENSKIPLLAICYGMQVLNVSRDGTLYQDIERQISGVIKHDQGKPLERNSHSINIVKGSLLDKIAENSDNINVNSHHHQSVKDLGKNLRISAQAKDAVVECIEDNREDRFVLGVQWHPELSWKFDELSKGILKAFVEVCSKHS